jgi:NitT/TauT family transport system substrate-binding protein
MKRHHRYLVPLAATSVILASAVGAGAQSPAAPTPATVSLQLQWVPQAQFAGYLAASALGFYEDEGLTVNLVPGGPTVDNQGEGSRPNGPEFTIAWVPKVLVLLDQDPPQSDLVNIAQVFQRSGTRQVSWAPGKGPEPVSDQLIDAPEDFAGKKIGGWPFGNELEVVAAGRKVGLEPNVDYTQVEQPFDMSLLLNRQIDAAEAMIYNEYAQVLEALNPATGELYQAEDLTVIDYNEVGAAMLQDALWARASWLAQPGNEDVAIRFLKASFRGWAHCRDNFEECVQITLDAGTTLGAGHQAWMLNEINTLIWPADGGIGTMPVATWDQTVQIAIDAGIIKAPPAEGTFRTDLAEAARALLPDLDLVGAAWTKGTVEVTPGGE